MHMPRRLRAQLALAASDGAMIGRVLAETAVTVAVTADATAPPHTETPYPRQLESERKAPFVRLAISQYLRTQNRRSVCLVSQLA